MGLWKTYYTIEFTIVFIFNFLVIITIAYCHKLNITCTPYNANLLNHHINAFLERRDNSKLTNITTSDQF